MSIHDVLNEGSPDLRALSERIEQMRPVPFGLKDVTALVAACLLPMVPVLATVMPLEEVAKIVLKVLG